MGDTICFNGHAGLDIIPLSLTSQNSRVGRQKYLFRWNSQHEGEERNTVSFPDIFVSTSTITVYEMDNMPGIMICHDDERTKQFVLLSFLSFCDCHRVNEAPIYRYVRASEKLLLSCWGVWTQRLLRVVVDATVLPS
jgi:hypothetical protein